MEIVVVVVVVVVVIHIIITVIVVAAVLAAASSSTRVGVTKLACVTIMAGAKSLAIDYIDFFSSHVTMTMTTVWVTMHVNGRMDNCVSHNYHVSSTHDTDLEL